MSDYLRGVRGYLAFGGRNFLHAVNEPVAAQGVHHVDDRLFRLRPERVGQLLLQATQLRRGHVDIIRVILHSGIPGTKSRGHTQQSTRGSQSRLAHSHKRRASTTSGTSQIQRARANGRENGTQHAPLRNDLIEPVEHVHKLLPLVLHATNTRGASGHALHDLAEISALELRENVNRAGTGEIHEVGAGGGGLQVHIHVQGVVLVLELLDAFLGTAHIQVEIRLILGVGIQLDLLRRLTQTADKTLLLQLDVGGNGQPRMLKHFQTGFELVGTIQIQADATILFGSLRLGAGDTLQTGYHLAVVTVIQHQFDLCRILLNGLQHLPVAGYDLVRILLGEQVLLTQRTGFQNRILHVPDGTHTIRDLVLEKILLTFDQLLLTFQQLRIFFGRFFVLNPILLPASPIADLLQIGFDSIQLTLELLRIQVELRVDALAIPLIDKLTNLRIVRLDLDLGAGGTPLIQLASRFTIIKIKIRGNIDALIGDTGQFGIELRVEPVSNRNYVNADLTG